MNRIAGLDLLRAIAIVWVMLFHSFLVGGLGIRFDWLSRFGWVGVDMFFVLSGFLIGTQVLRPLQRGEGLSIRSFYVRRAWRIVPAFAVGRTQQILYHLDELFCAGALQPFPVYLDSPMAIEATRIYRSHPDLFDDEAAAMEQACEIIRGRNHIITTPTPQDSMKLNDVSGPCLIMAGSGMVGALTRKFLGKFSPV